MRLHMGLDRQCCSSYLIRIHMSTYLHSFFHTLHAVTSHEQCPLLILSHQFMDICGTTMSESEQRVREDTYKSIGKGQGKIKVKETTSSTGNPIATFKLVSLSSLQIVLVVIGELSSLSLCYTAIYDTSRLTFAFLSFFGNIVYTVLQLALVDSLYRYSH